MVTTEQIDIWGNIIPDANIVSNTYDNGKGVITFNSDVTEIGEGAFWGCSSLESITIPNSVTEIGKEAFYYCSSLTSITIPNSVTEIGDHAFSYCSSLESITIPESVTSIGEGAFADCSSLASITIPDGVTSIVSAFAGCESLASVTIPDSVTFIGESAFSGCESLASVTIPDSVTSIGDYAFSSCRRLESVNIPNSVTFIGECAFSSCWRLASVNIPNSVTSIGDDAFRDCSNLVDITIPDSVTSIGDYAFSNTSLTSVYCKPTTPPRGGERMFMYYNYTDCDWYFDCMIYVPTESVEAYKAAYGWSVYKNYIVGYDFGGDSGDTNGVKEVAANCLWGMWCAWDETETRFTIFGVVSDKLFEGNPSNDSWSYGFMVFPDTKPINDEVPLGTYTYVDYEKLVNGEVELKTDIFTHLVEAEWHCSYTNANGEIQNYKYTEGTMVVSEGKIELTVTLENGEVHHVVYEGSLQTWGEGA